MGDDAVGDEPRPTSRSTQMEQLLHDALDAGAMGFSTSQAPTHNDGDGNPVPSRAATRDELVAPAPARRARHAGTQLELIIAGLPQRLLRRRGRPHDVDVARRRPAAQLERARRRRRAACTSTSSTPARAAASAARGSSRSRCRRAMRIRLSFLTGFVLDGLPGWRETHRRCRSPERMRALGDPEVRARLDEQAHSPEAGVLAEPGALGAARGRRERSRPRPSAFEGRTIGDIATRAGQGAVRRAARHRDRRRAAHRVCAPTSAAPSPTRRGRCAPTCGATRARSSAAPTRARTST